MYFSDTSNLSMNSAKKQIFSILNHIEEVIIVSMFALMVIIIFVQVIMRKAGNSLSWSEELGKFLFVWISWMGISLGQREGEHIKITMLTDRLPFRLAQIVNIISDIVVIIICAVIFYYGVELVVAQGNVPYAGIKISTSWGYLAVVRHHHVHWRHRPADRGLCLCADRFCDRRPGVRFHAGLHVLRRPYRLRHGHHLCHRRHDDPRNEAQGL